MEIEREGERKRDVTTLYSAPKGCRRGREEKRKIRATKVYVYVYIQVEAYVPSPRV